MIAIENVMSEIKELAVFEGFSDLIMKSLLLGARVKNFKHRELLYQAGFPIESFSIVLRGAFKLVKPTVRGDDVIIYFASPGDAIGAIVMNKPMVEVYPVTAKAMGPSLSICIPRQTYITTWAENVEVQKRINSMLFARMSVLQDEKALSKSPLAQRISRVLVNLLARNETDDVHEIPIPLTRQEIADSLGVAVESVIRVMSLWDHQGIIKTQDQRIQIIKIDQIIKHLNEN